MPGCHARIAQQGKHASGAIPPTSPPSIIHRVAPVDAQPLPGWSQPQEIGLNLTIVPKIPLGPVSRVRVPCCASHIWYPADAPR